MITATAYAAMEACMLRNMASAQFQCGETWYNGTLDKDVQTEAHKITATMTIEGETAVGETVTAVRILDGNGSVIAQRTENILRSSTNMGILYRFEFTISASEG